MRMRSFLNQIIKKLQAWSPLFRHLKSHNKFAQKGCFPFVILLQLWWTMSQNCTDLLINMFNASCFNYYRPTVVPAHIYRHLFKSSDTTQGSSETRVFFLSLFSCNFDDHSSPNVNRLDILSMMGYTNWEYLSLTTTNCV